MSLTIEADFLNEVKLQCRITHTQFDALIKREIEVAIEYIYTQLILNNNIPTSTSQLTAKQKLAVSHLVLQYRNNGDGVQAISNKYKVINSRLIRNILGNELRYAPAESTATQEVKK